METPVCSRCGYDPVAEVESGAWPIPSRTMLKVHPRGDDPVHPHGGLIWVCDHCQAPGEVIEEVRE